jgi:hypothetical protein
MNLCADDHRRRSRERGQLPRLHQSTASDPADLVVDRLEDAWVVAQVAELPDRQRQVVYAVADEGGVPAAAHRLGVSRQSAESMLKRARAAVRARIAVTLGALGLAGWRRNKIGAGAGGAAAGLAAVSLGLIVTLPGVLGHSAPPAVNPGRGHAGVDRTHHSMGAADLGVVRRTVPTTPISYRAPAAGAAAASDHAPPTKVLVPPRDYQVGPAQYHAGGATLEDRDQTIREEIQGCIDRGVEISPSYIGCRRNPNA